MLLTTSSNAFSYTTVERQKILNQEYEAMCDVRRLLPIKVTPFFQQKIEEEIKVLDHTEGPLHRIAYPTEERISVRVPGEVADFVGDNCNMPDHYRGVIIHKYSDRLLFFITQNCSGHCQYCFRQDLLVDPVQEESSLDKKLDLLQAYLNEHSEVKEVILSGGDPMMLSHASLEKVLRSIARRDCVSIRIHTRMIVYNPSFFESEALLKLLQETHVRLVFHIVHPYEICKKVEKVINAINDCDIRCYNQFPVLRKINDHVDVLLRLLEKLDALRVRNLSVFFPDAIHYSASFRVPFKRLFKMMDEINWHSPSWLNAIKFTLDTKFGKVQRENLQSYDEERQIAVFSREGKSIPYPDFPETLDEAGKIETLLWKKEE